jgi:hypothetical protein
MKLDNTRFARKKSEAERKAEKLKVIKNADDVWKQQSGSDDEIALLYVALARAAGLKAWPMQVVNRSRALFDPRFLSPGQLDDYIAVVELGGKDVYLDPGQKMCPFGALYWAHAFASGFRLSEKGATIATTPYTAASKQILIPASLFDAHSHASFVDREQRFEPVDMHYCEQITDRLVYHLPPGFAAEPAPQDTKLSWPEHAVLVTRTESAPGQITVARSFARAFTVTKPEEYPALHDFYQKVAAADHQQLVLTATSTQNGN